MFGRATGSRTRWIVAARVLPSAYDASRTWRGVASRPSRVAPTISGSASSESTVQQISSERPKTAPPSPVVDEEAEALLGEERQPEQREHDARRAGDHLDAGLDHPREPRRLAVLGQPDRGGDARAARRSRSRRGRSAACRGSGRGSRRTSPGRPTDCGRLKSSSGRRYWMPLIAPCRARSRRRSRSARARPPSTRPSSARSRSGQARHEPEGSVRVTLARRTAAAAAARPSRSSERTTLETMITAANANSVEPYGLTVMPSAPCTIAAASGSTGSNGERRRRRSGWARRSRRPRPSRA